MIEHGELKFDSKEEEDDAWYAMLHSWNRYKKRAEHFSAKKKGLTQEEFEAEYLHKHGYDWK